MIPVLLGALASLLIGFSDFFGSYATKRSNAITTTAGAFLAGSVVSVLSVPILATAWSSTDLAYGAASGVFIALSLALLYQSIAVSSVAVGSPIVALGASLIPATWDAINGTLPSTLALVGAAISVAGILVITVSPELRTSSRQGVQLAVVAAVLAGISLTLLGQTDLASGSIPAAGQRVAGLLVLLSLAQLRGVPRLPPRSARRIPLLSGTTGTLGIIAFTAGTQRGSLTTVAVAASMFPAVTAVLAWAFDDDVLRTRQAIGIGAVILGVSLMALA